MRLNEEARLSHVADLIARKRTGPELSVLDDSDLEFHQREYERLRGDLESSYQASTLPEEPSARPALNDPVRLRMRTTADRIVAAVESSGPCRRCAEVTEMKRSMSSQILVSHQFRDLHGHLIELLRSLSPEDWDRPTVCSAWCVKDIASHLFDGDLRRLSIERDGYVATRRTERVRLLRVPGRLPDQAQRRLDRGDTPHQSPQSDLPPGGHRRKS